MIIDDPEQRWLAETYKRGQPQLTVRAVITGMLLGVVMCLSNLYIVLKTGWSFGVTITACILAYAIWYVLGNVGLSRRPFGVLENNAMSSVASAAGYMTGGGNMAALPSLLMLTGIMPNMYWMMVWFAVISILGVFTAIPIKRQLINIEQLPFPTGTATAETLKTLHSHGTEGVRKARLLAITALIGVVICWLREAKGKFVVFFSIPEKFSLPVAIQGTPLKTWGLAFEGGLLMFSSGALMSFKTGWSLLLGAIACYGVLAPEMVARGIIKSIEYKVILQWSLWGGAALLLSSGLMSFGLQWRSIARSFRGLGRLLRRAGGEGSDPLAEVECPPIWFPLAYLALGPVMVWLMWFMFAIPWWAGCISLVLAVLFGMVASRVTGETDITPTKALGPVTQFVYGAMRPGDLQANIMGANVTGGIGLHSADLLTDLKSGWLVGANPRKQLIGQLFGCIAGAAAIVPVFRWIVPDASVLGSDQLPAPSAMVWAGVSKVLVAGPSALHPTAQTAAIICAVIGVALVLLEKILPARAKAFVPSPSGLGLGMVVPGSNSVMMFLGGLFAELVRRRRPASYEATVVPIASGFIIGESLLGILIMGLKTAGVMPR